MKYTYGVQTTRVSANVNLKVFIISPLPLYYRIYQGYLAVDNRGIFILIVAYLGVFYFLWGNILHVFP